MADYTRQEWRPPARVEYLLSCPTNGAELAKAYNAAALELGDPAANWDDVIKVEVRDAEIVLWFEKPEGAS